MPTRSAPKRRKPTPKVSVSAAGRLADRILKDLEAHTQDFKARKQDVATLPKADLIRKIRGQTSHSPFIVLLSWFTAAQRGTTITATLGIYNPDPITYLSSDLFAHAFWGPGNVVTDLDTYVLSAVPGIAVAMDITSQPLGVLPSELQLPEANAFV